jgi:hypothetical protein
MTCSTCDKTVEPLEETLALAEDDPDEERLATGADRLREQLHEAAQMLVAAEIKEEETNDKHADPPGPWTSGIHAAD